MSTVINVENLGKKYTLCHQQQGDNSSLREVITNRVASLGRKILSPFARRSSPLAVSPAVEDFWALKDVSFEVQQGERIGIIGRNGAGKSTLLKILSRITEPTTGRVRIKGRVASLLEVGTGFHPELTGRENIYLNGAILGMGRQEISRKFDEIVAFSEIEKFLDTPVKRYSSGMYVRLAFAVAAHLEPEILIVDEVLAVGDAAFQKKCLGKMEEVGREGRTVLFVSHNMAAVQHVCEKAMLLEHGNLKKIGNTNNVLENYQLASNAIHSVSLSERKDRNGNGNVIITSVFFCNNKSSKIQEVYLGHECEFVINYEAKLDLNNLIAKFTICTIYGQPVIHFDSSNVSDSGRALSGNGSIVCNIQKFPLASGKYTINVSIESNGELLDHVSSACSFVVCNGDFFESGRIISGLEGTCLVQHQWSFK